MTQLKTGIDKAIFIWGVFCLVGFSLWQFWQPTDFFGTINISWIIASIIGLGAMFFLVKNLLSNKINAKIAWAWIVIVILGELASIGLWMKWVDLGPVNYAMLWAGLMGIGFLLTGYWWASKTPYYVAGILCLAILALVWLKVPPIAGFQWAFVPLGLASGLPQIYDSAIRK